MSRVGLELVGPVLLRIASEKANLALLGGISRMPRTELYGNVAIATHIGALKDDVSGTQCRGLAWSWFSFITCCLGEGVSLLGWHLPTAAYRIIMEMLPLRHRLVH